MGKFLPSGQSPLHLLRCLSLKRLMGEAHTGSGLGKNYQSCWLGAILHHLSRTVQSRWAGSPHSSKGSAGPLRVRCVHWPCSQLQSHCWKQLALEGKNKCHVLESETQIMVVSLRKLNLLEGTLFFHPQWITSWDCCCQSTQQMNCLLESVLKCYSFTSLENQLARMKERFLCHLGRK